MRVEPLKGGGWNPLKVEPLGEGWNPKTPGATFPSTPQLPKNCFPVGWGEGGAAGTGEGVEHSRVQGWMEFSPCACETRTYANPPYMTLNLKGKPLNVVAQLFHHLSKYMVPLNCLRFTIYE